MTWWETEVLNFVNRKMGRYGLRFEALDDFVGYAEDMLGKDDKTVAALQDAMREIKSQRTVLPDLQ